MAPDAGAAELADVERDGLRARADAELAVDAAQMRLDRVLGEPQRLGDLAVGLALHQLAQHLLLAVAQRAVRARHDLLDRDRGATRR